MAPDLVEQRIALLNRFLEQLAVLTHGKNRDAREDQYARELGRKRGPAQDVAEARAALNRMSVAVTQAVEAAGVTSRLIVRAPPVIGGGMHTVNLFTDMFNQGILYGGDIKPILVDTVNKALGVYEALKDGSQLVQLDLRDGIDIVSAIDRSLRPAFKDPPINEKAVQDQIATILRAIGVEAHREQERVAIGTTTFIPDFTVPDLNLAIEVKLSNDKHSESDVQRELAEDVAAFGVQWKRLLAIVYDVGAIRDPEKVKREFEKYFGVQVLIIKH